MKKITSLLLLICLLLSTMLLTSCDDPKSLVDKAIKKTEALNSYEVLIYTKIVTRAGDGMVEVPMTVNLKVKDAQTDSPIIYADLTAEALGETTTMSLYMEGEWIYICSSAGDYRISRSDMTSSGFDYESDVESILRHLPDSIFQDVDVVDNNDGSQSVSIDLPKEIFSEVYYDLIKSVHSDLGGSFQDKSFDISETKVDVTVKDGYVAKYAVQFDIVVDVENVETTSTVTASLTYRNPGKDVNVVPPTGYVNFPIYPVA